MGRPRPENKANSKGTTHQQQRPQPCDCSPVSVNHFITIINSKQCSELYQKSTRAGISRRQACPGWGSRGRMKWLCKSLPFLPLQRVDQQGMVAAFVQLLHALITINFVLHVKVRNISHLPNSNQDQLMKM